MRRTILQVKPIIITGIVAGTLDLVTAMLIYQVKPDMMLKHIASGYFGRADAFSGGTEMIIAGFLFHYIIAFFWTTLFLFLYIRIALYKWNHIVLAVAYGILVWSVMNLVVLPASKIPTRPFDLQQAALGALILVLMIATPATLFASYFRKRI